MRYIPIYFSLLLLILAGCEEDSFQPVDVSPPSNLSIRFDMAADDSGEVTIYPEAEGAALFDVFFGLSPTETAVNVQPGNGASAIYSEGTYTVRVIAYNLEGESIETTQELNVQFTPPSNLQVEVTIDPINTNVVTVTPTADNATLFDIFFGDVMDEVATQIMPGAAAEHTYEESGQYTLRVVARSASSTTLEYTEVLDIIRPAEMLSLPIDFENPDVNYAFTEFGGANLSVVDNPDQSGENTSSKVGRLFKMNGSEVWAGGLLTLPSPIDFSMGDQFTVKVWSPKSGATVRFKIENLDDGNIFYETDATTTTSNAWETLSFDLSPTDLSNEYSKIVLFMDFGNAGDDSEYFFDDIIQESAASSLNLPLDFEAEINYEFTNFGNVTGSRIANPDPSGINTSGFVAQINKPSGAETWGGAFLRLSDPIDFETTDQIFIKVWSPKVGSPVRIKVENSDNGDIFFELDVTTTVANAWEELQYDFSTIDKSQIYDTFVIFFDFGNPGDDSDYYFDDARVDVDGGGGPTEVLALPIDFESDEITYMFTDFGDAGSTRVDNPDASGINTSNKVGQLVKSNGAQTWGGSFLELPSPIDFSAGTTFSVKVWSPKEAITVLLKIENATDGNIFVEMPVTTSSVNEWETLTFDMSAIDPSQDYSKVVIFFDFGTMGDGSTYYFDDITLE